MQDILTIKMIIALFPSIFMLHELEEIVEFKIFDSKRKHFPKFVSNILKNITTISTSKFTIVVLEEFLVLLIISFFCIYFECSLMNYIYTAIMYAYNIHIIVHIIQALIVRGYIPGLILGIVSFFITCDFIYHMGKFDICKLILFILIILIIIFLNLLLTYAILIKKDGSK